MKRELKIREAKHADGNISQYFECVVEHDGYTASNGFYEEAGKSADDLDVKEKVEKYFSHIEKIVRGILSLNLIRELKITPYRAPNYFEDTEGKRYEGDVYTTEVRSKDGRCYGSMSMFMLLADLEDREGVTGLTEEMYKHLEHSIYRRPERFCQCKNKSTADSDSGIQKELVNEFRANNIV